MSGSTTAHPGAASRAAARPVRRKAAGPLRLAIAFLSGGASLAAAFGLLGLVLAGPAFRETGPGWLRPLPLAVTFLDRDGRAIGRRGIRHHDPLPLDAYPRHLIDAVLAAEDRRFFRHWGLDPIGTGRALLANLRAGAVVQGGSTLSQQLAKNLFLSGERTLERKVTEAFLAVWLEAQLGKAGILALYLDRAYLGGGIVGVAAAADGYFGKPVAALTVAEAALLAGLLQAPSRFAPHLGTEGGEARTGAVIGMMQAAGALTGPEAEAARRERPRAKAPTAEDGPGHFLDWAFREVSRLAEAGRFGDETVLAVTTTLDGAVQERAEAIVVESLSRDGPRLRVGEAAAVLADGSGGVRALVGGRDYGTSRFNRAADALRQPGSAFKPFVYAAALAELPLGPDTIVSDEPVCLERWCPRNSSRSFSGALPLTAALARSVNTVAVRLETEIGRARGVTGPTRAAEAGSGRVAGLARSLGIRTPLRETPALALGASEVTLLDLTASVAAFGAGGRIVEPHAVLAVRNGRGRELYRRESGPGRVALGPNLVADMTGMLAAAVGRGTGRRAALPGRPAAGKTGTASGYRDAWFVGFTAQLAAGIWFGNDDHSPTAGVTGGSLPASAWKALMLFAHRDLPVLPLGGAAPAPAQRSSPGGFAEPKGAGPVAGFAEARPLAALRAAPGPTGRFLPVGPD